MKRVLAMRIKQWVQFPFTLLIICLGLIIAACAPRVMQMMPKEGPPGTVVSLSMEYLVGWPRIEVGGKEMDYYQLKLLAADPQSQQVPAEELTWIEDKVLQFRIPDLPPGEYLVTIYDDKGPPEENVYAFLETTAYVIFPPVWPFVFRSNEAQVTLRVLPGKSGQGKMKNAK